MPLQIKGIDHIVLRVKDVDHAIRFYQDVLGCTMDRARTDIGLYHLRAGNAFIDLVDINGAIGQKGNGASTTEGRNMDHFAIRIENFNEPSIRTHLKAHNIIAGETVERYGAEGSGPSIYIEDPDGNIVELKGPPNA